MNRDNNQLSNKTTDKHADKNIDNNVDDDIEKTMNLIKIALNGYYKFINMPEYKNFKYLDKIELKLSDNDIDNNKIKCFNGDKLLYRGACTFFGKSGYVLNKTNSTMQYIWQWAWSIPGVSKSFSSKSHNLLNYCLVSFNDSDELLSQIKQYMINANSSINDILDFDIFIALAIYLTKIKLLISITVSTHEYDMFIKKLQKHEKNITLTQLSKDSKESNKYELLFSII